MDREFPVVRPRHESVMPRRTPGPATLASRRWLRFSTLCLLYFAQGVPFGFVTIALVALLSEQGATAAQTGGLIALTTLPWTFKLVWGPLIDSFRLPAFGTRRPWILLAQAGMAATLLIGVSSVDLTSASALASLGTIVFLHNCFASLQDVATDALAIDLLPEEERGRANGMMWASKLVGASIGGIGTAVVASRFGLQAALQAMAMLMVVIMLVPLFVREREGDRRFPWSRKASLASTGVWSPAPSSVARERTGPLAVVRAVARSLCTTPTFVFLLLAFGSGLVTAMFVPINAEVFTQRLGWSAESYSASHASFGTAGKLLGAIGGGLFCARIGACKTFLAGVVLTASTAAFFSATSALWAHGSYPHQGYLMLLETGLALKGVAFLTLAMNLSWTTAAATQFALYMSVSNLGYASGPLLTGLALAHVHLYALVALVALATATLLPLLDERAIRRRRREEAPDEANPSSGIKPSMA